MPNIVGVSSNQVPTNSMLGGLAYQDPDNTVIKSAEIENISDINLSDIESFLLQIKDEYDNQNLDYWSKMFNDANDRDVNTNIIRKTKYSLQKYGLWDGKANLDEGELIMIKEGKKIDEMGIRAYCRELGEKLGMSDNGLRSKLSKLNKYGLIER